MKKLALVLGGGATKGFAHIGVIQVLEEHGIKPDLIVGTSMGAIVGGVYATGMECEHILQISKRLTRKKLMDFNIFNVFFKTSILKGKKLRKVLYNEVGDITHEQLAIPFVAVATSLLDGKMVVLKEGKLLDNMLASSAIPSVYPSLVKDDKVYCDGGLVNNVPDDVARSMGKDYIVLAIDVIGDYRKQVERGKLKIVSRTINALTLMQNQITKYKGDFSDMRVAITQPDVSQMGFSKEEIEESINYGIKAMKRRVNQLKKLLED